MAKQKYYVVWEGRETGIFTDWPTTQKLVAGHPKAKHKSFDTKEAAEAAFSKGPSATLGKGGPSKSKKKSVTAKFEFDSIFDIHIFCDGACDPNPGKSGSGVAVYVKGALAEKYYGLYKPNGTNNTAELNALHQSMLIAKGKSEAGYKVQILADSTYAIKAMTTWGADWQRRGWKRKTGELVNAELIAKMYEDYNLIKAKVDIRHVKAHIGIEGNELADRLSMLVIKEKLVAFKAYEGSESISELLAMESG